MPCKYGPIFAPYLHDWTLYGINTVQKQVRIYMAFFLCQQTKMGSLSRFYKNACSNILALILNTCFIQFLDNIVRFTLNLTAIIECVKLTKPIVLFYS